MISSITVQAYDFREGERYDAILMLILLIKFVQIYYTLGLSINNQNINM